jgi:crossover junction endodeoxyribonuclease RusA
VLTLTFPYPPSVNSYWLQSGKRRYISKRGVEFKTAVKEICTDLPSFGDQPIEISIVLYPRNKRLLDIDNVCKAILDSMNGLLYTDDQQVWKLSVERGATIKGGGCQVTISEYTKFPSGT